MQRAPVGGVGWACTREGGWIGSAPSPLVCAVPCPAGLRKGEKGETLAHAMGVPRPSLPPF